MSDFIGKRVPDSLTIIKKEDFIKKMDEIENIQDKVHNILYHRNPFYVWWNLKKAKRLHLLVEEEMRKLYSQTITE